MPEPSPELLDWFDRLEATMRELGWKDGTDVVWLIEQGRELAQHTVLRPEPEGDWPKSKDEGYACSHCGFSPRNRRNWCDLGCGRDYNEMIPAQVIPRSQEDARVRRLVEAVEQLADESNWTEPALTAALPLIYGHFTPWQVAQRALHPTDDDPEET